MNKEDFDNEDLEDNIEKKNSIDTKENSESILDLKKVLGTSVGTWEDNKQI